MESTFSLVFDTVGEDITNSSVFGFPDMLINLRAGKVESNRTYVHSRILKIKIIHLHVSAKLIRCLLLLMCAPRCRLSAICSSHKLHLACKTDNKLSVHSAALRLQMGSKEFELHT